MLFDMDTLKRLSSKSSTNGCTIPQVFVTMSPETDATKRTKPSSKQRRIKIAIMGKSGVGKSGKTMQLYQLYVLYELGLACTTIK